MRGQVLRVTGVLAAALMLAGCAAEPVAPVAAGTSSSAGFSDEEMLALVTTAYERYQQVADAVAIDGGFDAARYEAVATGDALAEALRSAQQYVDAAAHAVGATTVVSVELQSFDEQGHEATTYVCMDVDQVDVVDASGQSIVREDRPSRLLFEVQMEHHGGALKVAQRELWDESC
ncbi:MAG: hypothetical protein JWP66_1363 [Naasia sp.]|nr:hypothetical protein [Naasia sp.]